MTSIKENTFSKNYKLPNKLNSYYSQMVEQREYLIEIVLKLPDEALDYTPHERKIETIGTLLLHIAGVEWSWIFYDIDKQEMDEEEWKYAFSLRKDVDIPQIKGMNQEFYMEKLHSVRKQVYNRLKEFKDEDLCTIIESEGNHYSIEWILHHLIEHEAMHIGQILLLRRMYNLEKVKQEKIL
ncbi:MAG: DinB family protein [Asgard group archaeon]|nr:DinB family protein [Asgard group archaeon]